MNTKVVDLGCCKDTEVSQGDESDCAGFHWHLLPSNTKLERYAGYECYESAIRFDTDADVPFFVVSGWFQCPACCEREARRAVSEDKPLQELGTVLKPE